MTPDWTRSIHHDGSPLYVQATDWQLGARVALRLRVDHDAPVDAVWLRTYPDGEETMTPMVAAEHDPVCRWWRAEMPLSMPRNSYRFLLVTAQGNLWYNATGPLSYYPPDANDFQLLAGAHGPAWARRAVFYQIFPDRFCDGDPHNNVRDAEYRYAGKPVLARPWGTPPDPASGSREFFGGDLQGIVQRLDYLEDLGVNALYLNPIFTAPSNHKYDVASYEQVDPHLGGNQALVELRTALSERAMRLMLDIVPNHCGATHPWFTAAQADPHAPSAEFFSFSRHPDQYASWLGVASLPRLNYRSERLRQLMYAGPEAILRRWLRPPYAIDGWRIDVANMLGRQGADQHAHELGRAIRQAIKAEAPEAYLIGEHFFDGTPHLQGDELDASMNYRGFTFPIWHWLSGQSHGLITKQAWADRRPLDSAAVAAQWTAFRAAMPWAITVQQFNLLGSHDTPRLRTILRNDPQLLRIAFVLLFTYPGVPCLYYGDEVGLNGGADPGSRSCMPWDASSWDHDLRGFVQRLARLRRQSLALSEGGFQQVYAEGHTLAFQREAPGERLLIVARRADDGLTALPVRHAGLPDGASLRDLLSGSEARVAHGHLPLAGLPASGVMLWHQVEA